MDSYEFIKGINSEMDRIRLLFDSTMALYTVIGTYDGITVSDSSSEDAALVSYTINGSKDAIARVVESLSNTILNVYTHTYLITISEVYDDRIVIKIQDRTVQPEV